MPKIQLECGFVIPAVLEKMRAIGVDEEKTDSLLKTLAVFEVDSDSNLNAKTEADDLILVIHNLLLRGVPTFLWYDLERHFAARLGSLQERERLGGGYHAWVGSEELIRTCWKAMHVIDPRIDRWQAVKHYQMSWEQLDSHCEEQFFFQEIPRQLFQEKGDFLIQLFQPQRSLETMVEDPAIRRSMQHNFREQLADFVLEFPYLESKESARGVCLEVDGPHHREQNQKHLDGLRDKATREANWHPTLRFPVEEFGTSRHRDKFSNLTRLLQTDAIQCFKENFEHPLYESSQGLLALQLVLSPFAVARVQFTLVKAIISGKLSLGDDVWKIAVIERDVPCAHLAIDNLKEVFSALATLENEGKKLPEIELKVYHTPEFAQANLNEGREVFPLTQLEEDREHYDLCIDVSILIRKGLFTSPSRLNARSTVTLRSAFHKGDETPFLSGNPIRWRPLLQTDDRTPIPEAEDSLTYFLRNIFRKKAFRAGQIPILHYALQHKTVIGLLPTGGGKSLTYQIAGLLQPGIVIVIDPLISLMQDQVDGLRKVGVNRTLFINSLLKTHEARSEAYRRMKSGNALFCFVSPERLQMQSFRNYLEDMYQRQVYFTYGVIDEVHCVSEWGHDFRTSYLSLGENLIRYCQAKSGKIALFGLTATASFDVLADVQRELSGNDSGNEIPDDRIIRHETTNRDEIQFIIDPVALPEEELEEIQANSNSNDFDRQIKTHLGKRKQDRTQYWIKNISAVLRQFSDDASQVVNEELIQLTYEPHKQPAVSEIIRQMRLPDTDSHDFWTANGERAGLIFAPHRSWYFGVTDKYVKPERGTGIYDFLIAQNRNLRLGTYMGVDEELLPKTAEKISIENINNQSDFLNDRLDLMVATKAFGMGIDKSNIRFTIHNCYPGSIESFVQEAGRAGRDRKMAVSVILFNNQQFQYNEQQSPFEPDFDVQAFFHSNSFKGTIKEKAVLYELLTSIQFPKVKNAQFVAMLLSRRLSEYGEEVDFKINYRPDHDTIWLDDKDGNAYGYIKRDSGASYPRSALVDHEFARLCLEQLWSILCEEAPVQEGKDSLLEWLNQKGDVQNQPGIEKLLEDKPVGAKLTVTIPFTNDEEKVFRAVARLCKALDQRISPEVVKDNHASAPDAFLENLASRFFWNDWRDKVRIAAELNNISEEQFLQRLAYRLGAKRDKLDTEKALYRLTLIGVVEGYTVDFRTGTFEATIFKKEDRQYHEHLRHYLGKFYSTLRVDQTIARLNERRGDSEIQRILNFLVEFIYEEIAKKRFESIKTMRELCEVGSRQGNIEMKSWIHLYFNSKYARRGYSLELDDETVKSYRTLRERRREEEGLYNISLLDWSDEGKLMDLDWVFDFIQIVQDDYSGGQIENLKHLRGACIRLLIVNPDNYVFYLLRAYAVILLSERLPDEQIKLETITDDLLNGWKKYAESGKTNREVYQVILEFRQAIRNQIAPGKVEFLDRIHAIFEQAIFLLHSTWARDFNGTLSSQLRPIMSHERST